MYKEPYPFTLQMQQVQKQKPRHIATSATTNTAVQRIETIVDACKLTTLLKT